MRRPCDISCGMKFFRRLELALRWNNLVLVSPSRIQVSRECCLILMRRRAVNPMMRAFASLRSLSSACESPLCS